MKWNTIFIGITAHDVLKPFNLGGCFSQWVFSFQMDYEEKYWLNWNLWLLTKKKGEKFNAISIGQSKFKVKSVAIKSKW